MNNLFSYKVIVYTIVRNAYIICVFLDSIVHWPFASSSIWVLEKIYNVANLPFYVNIGLVFLHFCTL